MNNQVCFPQGFYSYAQVYAQMLVETPRFLSRFRCERMNNVENRLELHSLQTYPQINRLEVRP